MNRDGVVIVGGGLAGQRCAEALRRAGYDRPIRIACAETRPPYDRPPLSKGVLSGEHDLAALAYRPEDWYTRRDVQLLLDARAMALRPGERRLTLEDGSELRFDRLLIATGSAPRMLPALQPYSNVSVLRDIGDAQRLRDVLTPGAKLVVIGAGFIGLEVAATARKLDVDVTVIEALASPLERVLNPELGKWFARMHREEGVEVATGVTVGEIHGNGTVRRLTLSDGRTVDADHVVVGIGVVPDVGWLEDSGLTLHHGVAVDQDGRTGCAHVFAAGDAAATFDPRIDRHVVGSHWEAAARQGARTARAMLGLDPGSTPLTSFWTDQYGIRIQYLGHASLSDAISIDGSPEERNFTAWFTHKGKPVAALLAGRQRELPAARAAIENGAAHELPG